MSTMASQITSLTIVYSTIYSGADKKTIKAVRHWPLWGEFTGDRWIPQTKGQWRGFFPFDDVIMSHNVWLNQGHSVYSCVNNSYATRNIHESYIFM